MTWQGMAVVFAVVVVALIAGMTVLADKIQKHKCPHCRTKIFKSATVCPSCTREVTA